MAKTYRVTFMVRASTWIVEQLMRAGVKIGPSRFPFVPLTVRGRKSGQPRTTLVVTAEYHGKRYSFWHVWQCQLGVQPARSRRSHADTRAAR